MLMTAVAVTAVAFLLGCVFTAAARGLAPRLGLVDRPDGGRKRHAHTTPLMGGVAIGLSFCLAALMLAAVASRLPLPRPVGGRPGLLPLLASAALFCFLGLYDDRYGLRPRYKLLWQIAACLPFVLWGESITKLGVLGSQWSLGAWSVPFTIFWLVACSNVINLMDGLDGLAGTISCIALLTLAAMSLLIGRGETAVVALAAAASVAGFLVHNWPPAKIFMGDSGSLMLGFLIGAFAIQAALKQTAGFTLVVPLVLISVPIFDTAMAILRRKLNGRGIGEADRGHFHHHLQDRGLTRVQSLLLIAGLCVAMSGFGMLSFWVHNEMLALLLCGSLIAALVIARVFGHYEAGLAFQHVRAIAGLLLETSRLLPSRLKAVQLTNMPPEESDHFWQLACRQLAQCGGRGMEIRFTGRADRRVLYRLSWNDDEPIRSTADTWQMKHTVLRDNGICAELTANGTMDNLRWARHLNEASQLIHLLCRTWPLESARFAKLHEADVIRFDEAGAETRPNAPRRDEAMAGSVSKPRAA